MIVLQCQLGDFMGFSAFSLVCQIYTKEGRKITTLVPIFLAKFLFSPSTLRLEITARN